MPYYFFSLFFSCISLSVVIVIFSGELSWLLPGIIVYSFYIVIPYLIFAVPLQITFNKRPRKFNVFYLLIYTVLSFVAAAIYWFWDSVFLQKKIS
ncbi:UPF0715 family protein [Bacillus sp. ISL-4]|nr:UPF0715 family protein [Bacillus sp. ISL-4]